MLSDSGAGAKHPRELSIPRCGRGFLQNSFRFVLSSIVPGCFALLNMATEQEYTNSELARLANPLAGDAGVAGDQVAQEAIGGPGDVDARSGDDALGSAAVIGEKSSERALVRSRPL